MGSVVAGGQRTASLTPKPLSQYPPQHHSGRGVNSKHDTARAVSWKERESGAWLPLPLGEGRGEGVVGH